MKLSENGISLLFLVIARALSNAIWSRRSNTAAAMADGVK